MTNTISTPSLPLDMEWDVSSTNSLAIIRADASLIRAWNAYMGHMIGGDNALIYAEDWRPLYEAGRKLSTLTRLMNVITNVDADVVFVLPSRTPGTQWHSFSLHMMMSVYDVNADVEKALGTLVAHWPGAWFVNGWYMIRVQDALDPRLEANDEASQAVETVCRIAQERHLHYVRFVPEYASV